MIDLVKAENVFKNYVSQFHSLDNKIAVKIKHTYGVVEMAEYIATGLNLKDEDVQLAKLIALLHDIGRFEQAVKYDNFDDYNTAIDHADYGAKILFEDNMIREFIEFDKFDDIIRKAIINHDKFEIEKGLSDRELLHAKIIRDADKTDNFIVKQYQDFESLYKTSKELLEKETITDEVWQEFLSGKTIISSHRKTNMDKWLSYIAWIYDYNFIPSLKYLLQENCIDKVIDRLDYKNLDTKEKMEIARKLTKEYIRQKLEDKESNS